MTEQENASCQYWWFGINNEDDDPDEKRHMLYPEVEPFLLGETDELVWRHPRRSKLIYNELNEGDKVLLWMGDGKAGHENWGVIGFARICLINRNDPEKSKHTFHLEKEYFPKKAFTPYTTRILRGKSKPSVNETTAFLRDVFTLDFPPLITTFREVGYLDRKIRSPIITIVEISKDQYKEVLERVKSIQ